MCFHEFPFLQNFLNWDQLHTNWFLSKAVDLEHIFQARCFWWNHDLHFHKLCMEQLSGKKKRKEKFPNTGKCKELNMQHYCKWTTVKDYTIPSTVLMQVAISQTTPFTWIPKSCLFCMLNMISEFLCTKISQRIQLFLVTNNHPT